MTRSASRARLGEDHRTRFWQDGSLRRPDSQLASGGGEITISGQAWQWWWPGHRPNMSACTAPSASRSFQVLASVQIASVFPPSPTPTCWPIWLASLDKIEREVPTTLVLPAQ